MSESRRKFLKATAAAAVVAGISTKLALGKGAGLASAGFRAESDMRIGNEGLSRSNFTPYVSSVFNVRVKKGALTRWVPVTLVSVSGSRRERKLLRTAKSTSAVVLDENNFSLLFSGSLRTPIDQDVYDVRHPSLGTINVLLVRLEHEDRKRAYYEVIFNRSRP